MRILQVHNFYREPGGEDVVVADEARLLRDHGHQVELHSVHNDSIGGLTGQLRLGWELPYAPHSRTRFAQVLETFRPDLVHAHNLFPQLTASIYDAARAGGVPIVQTLHNFRFTCANAQLFRAGRPCEDCIQASPYRAAWHRCYRGSAVRSLAVARMIAAHRRAGYHADKVGRFIALTEAARDLCVRAGLPREKVVVKGNFAFPPTRPRAVGEPRFALYVGRLAPEKGIAELAAMWPASGPPLRVVGDGPEAARVAGIGNAAVEMLGRRPRDEVRGLMASAAFLVMPSLWYEGFPMVVIEAFAAGLPVLAARIGALAEIVTHGETGWHFEPGSPESILDAVSRLRDDPALIERMSINCRQHFEERLSPSAAYRDLMRIYREALRPV